MLSNTEIKKLGKIIDNFVDQEKDFTINDILLYASFIKKPKRIKKFVYSYMMDWYSEKYYINISSESIFFIFNKYNTKDVYYYLINNILFIKCKLYDNLDFEQSFIKMGSNGKWGFTKIDGTWIIKPIFDFIYFILHEGFARVKFNGKFFNLDTKGVLHERI